MWKNFEGFPFAGFFFYHFFFSNLLLCLLPHPVLWETMGNACTSYQNKLVLILCILKITLPISWLHTKLHFRSKQQPWRQASGINKKWLPSPLPLSYYSSVKIEVITADRVVVILCSTGCLQCWHRMLQFIEMLTAHPKSLQIKLLIPRLLKENIFKAWNAAVI